MNTADQTLIRSWLSESCVILLVCLSVTAPAIVISSSLPFVKVEALLVPVIAAFYLWLLLIGVARPIRLNAMFVIALLYFVCNGFSIWYGARILGHPVLMRDLYELPKVWLPVAFFTITYEATLSESSIRRLISCFSVSILLVCVYAWSQFFSLGFTYKLNHFYATEGGRIDSALEHGRRVYATVGNPNVLGGLMAFCVVLFVLAALFRVGNSLRNVFVALSCLITLVMTGSRSGALDIILALLLILLIAATAGRHRSARTAALVVLLPAFLWIFVAVATTNRGTLERYQTLKEPLQIDSVRARLEGGWVVGWSDFKSSPLFGHGPGKAFLSPHGGVIDSEDLSVLREKGSVGFLVFLGYYLYPLYLIRNGRKAIRRSGSLAEELPGHVVCVNTGFVMGVLALVMNVGMSTFYSPFLQGFLWLWLGISASCATRLNAAVPARDDWHVKPSQLHRVPA